MMHFLVILQDVHFNPPSPNAEKGLQLIGGLVVAFVAVVLMEKYFYKPLYNKIAGTKKAKVDTGGLQNELDYAAYLEWAAVNEYNVHFKKLFVYNAGIAGNNPQ